MKTLSDLLSNRLFYSVPVLCFDNSSRPINHRKIGIKVFVSGSGFVMKMICHLTCIFSRSKKLHFSSVSAFFSFCTSCLEARDKRFIILLGRDGIYVRVCGQWDEKWNRNLWGVLLGRKFIHFHKQHCRPSR